MRDKAKLTLEPAEGIAEAFAGATGEQFVTTDHLDARLESMKTDILRWMAVTQLALGGFIFTAFKLAP